MRAGTAKAFAILTLLAALAAYAPPAAASRSPKVELSSVEQGLVAIFRYRAKPDLARVPALMRELSRLGAFRDPEAAGVYVGFVAGVLAANPGRAEHLVEKLAALQHQDQWLLVRAPSPIRAYQTGRISCVLRRFACRSGAP